MFRDCCSVVLTDQDPAGLLPVRRPYGAHPTCMQSHQAGIAMTASGTPAPSAAATPSFCAYASRLACAPGTPKQPRINSLPNVLPGTCRHVYVSNLVDARIKRSDASCSLAGGRHRQYALAQQRAFILVQLSQRSTEIAGDDKPFIVISGSPNRRH